MPTARKRRKAPHRTYALTLSGELEGFHVTMGGMTAREMIRLRSGEITEGEAIEFAASKILEHDFDIADPLDLDATDLLQISEAWSAAMKAAAVPPVIGDS